MIFKCVFLLSKNKYAGVARESLAQSSLLGSSGSLPFSEMSFVKFDRKNVSVKRNIQKLHKTKIFARRWNLVKLQTPSML